VRLKVLIFGLKSIGIEAAKNLILAGPGLVTVADGARIFGFTWLCWGDL
jgi:molybdopterin/thiamine biosynthesis adenylyltransferase